MTVLASKTYVDALVVASSFDIIAASAKAFSHVNFNTTTITNGVMHNVYRASSAAQNDEVVFLLPQPLKAGTWTLVLTYLANTSFGIYTVSTSADAVTWTDRGTVDSYGAASVLFNRTEITGLTIPAGQLYVRLKMATKNGSSSGYLGRLTGVAGTRTGA